MEGEKSQKLGNEVRVYLFGLKYYLYQNRSNGVENNVNMLM